MAITWLLALTLLSSLLLPVTAAKAQPVDQYGGYTALPVPGGATGEWRTAKLDNRWVFVTPLGNAFWMRGVYNLSLNSHVDDLGGTYEQRVLVKYGNVQNWATQEVVRLKSWGFNTVAEYADWRAWDQVPTTYLFSFAPYALTRRFVTGVPQAPKDLLNGVNLTFYRGYQANMVDFFDPSFAAYVTAYVAANVAGLEPIYTSPRTIGFAADDRDYLYGFGAGPEVPAYAPHTHLGWIVLVTKFQQSGNSGLGQTYADTKVYGKYALRDQLVAKYGTIAALNAAWGSSYTTFDSAGGWGTGTGLLDEDGRHSWVPTDYVGLAGATTAMVTDLDNYLLEHARKYFSITSDAIRAAAPNALVFGPASLNSDGLTRKQILQAAGENVDVLQASIRNQTVLNLTAQYFGDKPIVTYELMDARPDSAFWRYPLPTPIDSTWEFTTQQDRGAAYASKVSTLLDYTSTNGVRPIAGLKWWEFHDRWNEKGNYGLTTLSDNAYDGVQAVIARGTDVWGYPTGGEERNYGDFLGPVITAHSGIASALGAGTGTGGGGTTPLTVSIISPQTGSMVSQSVTVSANASSTTSRIGLMLNGSTVAIVGGTRASYPWDTTTSPNGTHTWTAKAYDASGNSVDSAPSSVVVQNSIGAGDTTPPMAAIAQPVNGSRVLRKSLASITATAADNLGVTRVDFYVNGSLRCSSSTAPYTCAWKVPAAAAKIYSIQVKAYDLAGNVGPSSIVTVSAD